MNVKDLNTSLKLVGLVPLKMTGYCRVYTPSYREHHFTILEVDTGYQLIGADDFVEHFHTLKEALQQCYLNWGD